MCVFLDDLSISQLSSWSIDLYGTQESRTFARWLETVCSSLCANSNNKSTRCSRVANPPRFLHLLDSQKFFFFSRKVLLF